MTKQAGSKRRNPSGKASAFSSEQVRRWSDQELIDELRELNPAIGKPGERLFIPDALIRSVPPEQLSRVLSELRQEASLAASESVLALRLAARQRPRLFGYIQRIGSFPVGDAYRAIRLLDFGTESLVFVGENRNGNPVAIKLPFVDFTDLAHVDVQQLFRRRKRLVREAEMLARLGETALPRLIGDWKGVNPLYPPGLPAFLREEEQFLILEYIPGVRLDACARTLRQQDRGCCALRLAVAFLSAFLELSSAIKSRLGLDATYTDVKPENSLVKDSAIRIVDASSIVHTSVDTKSLPVSELYLDPVDHREWKAGRLIPDSGFVVRSAIRAVHALIGAANLFIAEAAPPWPQEALVDVAPALDALAAAKVIDLGQAASITRDLLARMRCEHGSASRGLGSVNPAQAVAKDGVAT